MKTEITTTEEARERLAMRWTGFEDFIIPADRPHWTSKASYLYRYLYKQELPLAVDVRMHDSLEASNRCSDTWNVKDVNAAYKEWNRFVCPLTAKDCHHNLLVQDWRSFLRSSAR